LAVVLIQENMLLKRCGILSPLKSRNWEEPGTCSLYLVQTGRALLISSPRGDKRWMPSRCAVAQ